MEHAGSNRGFIFFLDNGVLYILSQWGDTGLHVYSLPQERDADVNELNHHTQQVKILECKLANEMKDQIPFSLIQTAITGVSIESPFDYFNDYSLAYNVKSAVCIPMSHGGKLTGVLYLENTLTPGAFPLKQRKMLNHLAAQIGTSIERTSLHINMKKILKEVQKQNKMLIKLDKLKDEFVANTSHELKTPLNAILGFSQTLRETKLITGDQKEFCDLIISSAEGLLAVINDILDIQQYQYNTLSTSFSNFELRSTIDKIIRIMCLDQKPICLHCHFDPSLSSPIWLDGDHARLKQVLINLLSNAIKFTDKGNVILRISKNRTHHGEDMDENKKISLKFEVEDTGIGIDPTYLSQLFKPFSQADSSSIRKYQGAGLGLATSQKIIQTLSNHMSSIQCSSKFGRGSIFSFSLLFSLVQNENNSQQFDNMELNKWKDSIQFSQIFYVGSNSLTKKSFIDQLYDVSGIQFSYFNDLKEIDESLDNYYFSKIKPFHTDFVKKPIKSLHQATSSSSTRLPFKFCIIDTTPLSPTQFDEKFSLTSFLKKYKPYFLAKKIVFLFIVSIHQRSNFHTLINDVLHYPTAISPIISSPLLSNSVITSLGRIAGNFTKGRLTSPPTSYTTPLNDSNNNVKSSLSDNNTGNDTAPVSRSKTWDCPLLVPEIRKMNASTSSTFRKVIMFEDNKLNQRLQERFLKMLKFDCKTVENGQIGIDFLSESPINFSQFDLILMDCHMPVMDGFEATKNIRRLENQYNLPRKHVIAITASNGNFSSFKLFYFLAVF